MRTFRLKDKTEDTEKLRLLKLRVRVGVFSQHLGETEIRENKLRIRLLPSTKKRELI